MYALGLIPWLARIGTRIPGLANAMLRTPGISSLLKRTVGVTTRRPAPLFAARSLRREAPTMPPDATVVLWPDTFTDAYRPEIGAAWRAVFESVGERVAVPTAWACCGRPLYDAGMLDLARRTLTRLLDVLAPFIERGLPVVVPEPSCLAAFRDELPKLLHTDPRAAKLADLARSPAEHLLATNAVDRLPRPPEPADVLIHPHCHARAIHADDPDRVLLQRLGHRVTLADAGCCGLAGSFGFSAEHEPISRTIGERHWLPGLSDATPPGGTLVIDGFSCATQYSHLAPDGSPRPVTLVDMLSAPPRS